MRRGGVRQPITDRVTFKRDASVVHEGWALNASKGGLRAILDVEPETKVELGEEYDVALGDPDAESVVWRRSRIVWLQEEPDGFVVGIEYVGLSGTHAAAAPVEPDQTSGEKPKDD